MLWDEKSPAGARDFSKRDFYSEQENLLVYMVAHFQKMSRKENIMDKLRMIQFHLKAPKDKVNDYNPSNKYKYRTLDSILEAVKPLLNQYECILTLSDDLVNIGERYYIKATATIEDLNTKEIASVTAYAREVEVKKGSDPAQITGMTSSYARKYALNGLFCIDDTKDADDPEITQKTKETEESLCSNLELKNFMDYATKLGVDYKTIGKEVGATSLKSMTKEQHGLAMIKLMEVERENDK